MYLFYILYLFLGALRTQSSPLALPDLSPGAHVSSTGHTKPSLVDGIRKVIDGGGNVLRTPVIDFLRRPAMPDFPDLNPVTHGVSTGDTDLAKLAFGSRCTAFGFEGVVTFEKFGDTSCFYDISAAENVWKSSMWQFQMYSMDGSDNPLQLAAGKTCCIRVPCAAPYQKSFCRNNYKGRMEVQDFPFVPTQGMPHVGILTATDQGSPFIADPSAKLLCPQLGPNNPTSCWMKPSDPIPKPFFPPLHKEEKEENTKTGQDTVDQAPTTDSTDSELDPTIQSAFDPQSQPADYTAQEGTTGLPGILPAANPQSPAQPDTFQQASSSVPETQATTSQPNEMAFNDFQPGDLSSMFTETG